MRIAGGCEMVNMIAVAQNRTSAARGGTRENPTHVANISQQLAFLEVSSVRIGAVLQPGLLDRNWVSWLTICHNSLLGDELCPFRRRCWISRQIRGMDLRTDSRRVLPASYNIDLPIRSSSASLGNVLTRNRSG